MKFLFLFLFSVVIANSAFTQNVEGEWIGYFLSGPDSAKTTFSIEFFRERGQIVAHTLTEFKQNTRSFYSICKAKVKIDSSQKRIIVTEYKSIKNNIPFGSDCFQEHILRFSKENDIETLSGNWETAGPKQLCGKGITLLQRTAISQN